jgi:hypothetical protein
MRAAEKHLYPLDPHSVPRLTPGNGPAGALTGLAAGSATAATVNPGTLAALAGPQTV